MGQLQQEEMYNLWVTNATLRTDITVIPQ